MAKASKPKLSAETEAAVEQGNEIREKLIKKANPKKANPKKANKKED